MFKKWTHHLITLITLTPAILTGILYFLWSPALSARVMINRLEASVNASAILSDEVSLFRKTVKLRAQLDQLFSTSKLMQNWSTVQDQDIITYLIDEKIIAQHFSVSDAEVEQEITSIQNNNHLDRTSLTAALKEQGYRFENYFELIRGGIMHRNLIDREIRTLVHVSDDDVANYFYNHYSKNKNEPRAFHLQLISILIKEFKSQADAYNTALRAKNALEGGEKFQEVAARFNFDRSPGDLGVLTEDQMNPLIREQAKTLKIGEFSKIFGNAQTYMILKLTDVQSSESDYLEKNREKFRAMLGATAYEQQIALWLDRRRQSSFIHRAGESTLSTLTSMPSSKNSSEPKK